MLGLAARDLWFAYQGSAMVVQSFSAVFLPGKVVCVQAPSGRGKTTLLAILGGLLVPSEGSIALRGHLMSPDALRSASTWVLQSQNVFPTRTAQDNVALGAARDGKSWREAMKGAEALLDELGLGHRRNALAAHLSGGERQRMCVARAVHREVPVILADEPTANLDRQSARQVLTALRHAAGQGRVVIVASHDPEVGASADGVLHRW